MKFSFYISFRPRRQDVASQAAVVINTGRYTSCKHWQDLVAKVLRDAELFAAQIELFDEKKLLNDFRKAKYRSYYRSLQGIVERTHYHLGQIALIKNILREKNGVK